MNKDWTGNSKTAPGLLGASHIAKLTRAENDYYATDPRAGKWLLKLENLDENIWECACGEGHLAKVFQASGYKVKSTDLVDRGYGVGGVDFLKCEEHFDGDIITNPPYIYAQEFVEHALKLIPYGNKVIMFLKLQFLEGKRRKRLFEQHPPKHVWVSISRIRCGRNGVFDTEHSMIAYAWYVWEKGYAGDTILGWFDHEEDNQISFNFDELIEVTTNDVATDKVEA